MSFLKAKLLQITLANSDKASGGYAVIENPKMCAIQGRKFLEGTHAPVVMNYKYIHGKRVLIAFDQIVSITEFDSIPRNWKPKTRKKKQS